MCGIHRMVAASVYVVHAVEYRQHSTDLRCDYNHEFVCNPRTNRRVRRPGRSHLETADQLIMGSPHAYMRLTLALLFAPMGVAKLSSF